MLGRRCFVAAAAIAALASPADAETSGPALLPQRDAELAYAAGKVLDSGETLWDQGLYRVRVKAGGTVIRMEVGESPDSYLLIDHEHRRATSVDLNRRQYLPGIYDILALDRIRIMDPRMSFAEIGPDIFEGRSCTRWQAQGLSGSGTGCVAEDGTLLTAEGLSGYWTRNRVVLRSASYVEQPEGLFVIPPGFERDGMLDPAPR